MNLKTRRITLSKQKKYSGKTGCETFEILHFLYYLVIKCDLIYIYVTSQYKPIVFHITAQK